MEDQTLNSLNKVFFIYIAQTKTMMFTVKLAT